MRRKKEKENEWHSVGDGVQNIKTHLSFRLHLPEKE
jgi:hypothetical protein